MSENDLHQNYEKELTAQVSFLEQYLPMVDQDLKVDDVQNDYNDGVVNGNIIKTCKPTDENGKILSWNDPRTAKERSKTYHGIAQAMADQWGYLTDVQTSLFDGGI